MGAAKQQKAHEEKDFLKNSLLLFLIRPLFFIENICQLLTLMQVTPTKL
jgi:hypothetical protein